MDSIRVVVPTMVKAILTEKLKARLIKDCEDVLAQVNMEIGRIDYDEQRAAEEIPEDDQQQLAAMHNHFAQARNERLRVKAQTEERLASAKQLVLGAEIVHQQQLNRIVELKVGDDLNELNDMEVLIEDGKIIAFRG